MFTKILIANRGEIACRITETAQKMGIRTVAVFSDADRFARHVEMADEAIYLGPSLVSESYLRGDLIIQAAQSSGAQAIHPGYGFLSENPEFVESVEAAGLSFIGPSAASIRAMGLKDAAKKLMEDASVPVVPGYHGAEQGTEFLAKEAARIGYPVLIKARAGGGGKGMRLVEKPEDFTEALDSASREGEASFGDAAVLVEKYISSPRHIEVQVFGDSFGNVVHLYERDCSLQRRHQKVIEEAPAPDMPDDVRKAMTTAAVTAAKAINYQSAGTIEFIVDGAGPLRSDGFWFMEMNTRLQVEHPVTEFVTGLDLVETQLRVAAGEPLPFKQQDISITGHAFEARLYAEDVPAGFLPATGKIEYLSFDPAARNDTGVQSGDSITPFYDPMIAKITTGGISRRQALENLRSALSNTHVAGTVTNLDFLAELAGHKGFSNGEFDTGLIERETQVLGRSRQTSEVSVLLAALVLYDVDPVAAETAWRLWGDACVLCTLAVDGVSLKRRLTLKGAGDISMSNMDAGDELARVTIESRRGSRYRVRTGSMVNSANIVSWQMNSVRHASVQWAGKSKEFTRPDPLDRQNSSIDSADAVTAPMTGVVRVLDVEEGDCVTTGDRLVVVEAMKMETSLTAPRDGIVSSVKCAVDQTVEGGSVLVELST